MTASVEIKGMDEVLAKLDEKFSAGRVSRIENDALRVGGRLIAVNVKNSVSSFRDTGKTVQEVMVGSPKKQGGVRGIKVGWSPDGSGQRWRLEHLNEFGYTRWGRSYHPRGMGKLQSAYDTSKPAALALERSQLEKLL
jgi:hypothetical protein